MDFSMAFDGNRTRDQGTRSPSLYRSELRSNSGLTAAKDGVRDLVWEQDVPTTDWDRLSQPRRKMDGEPAGICALLDRLKAGCFAI